MQNANNPTEESPPAGPLRFRDVYQTHARYVWRVGRGLGVSTLHIDDVVHDVFLVVRRRLPDFQPERSLRAWLAGITRRVVGHLRRKHAREERRLRALPTPDPPSSPFETLERQDAAVLLERFLATLPDDKRMAFLLMDVEGLTANEVAEACGSHAQTIYSRRREARRQFERFVVEVSSEHGGRS